MFGMNFTDDEKKMGAMMVFGLFLKEKYEERKEERKEERYFD